MPIRRSQKKRSAEPQQKQNHRRPVIDPLVNPGSSAHRHQARSKTDQARPHHRMVTLAQSSPGDRSARAHQSKTATVMLGHSYATPRLTVRLGRFWDVIGNSSDLLRRSASAYALNRKNPTEKD